MSRLETFERLCQEISAILTTAGVTKKQLLASLPETRERIYALHYGKKPAKTRRPRKK